MSKPKFRRQSKPRKSEPVAPQWPFDVAVGIGLILAVFAVYRNIGQFLFINFDDPTYVIGNSHVTTGLTLENVRWALTTPVDSNWVPLTLVSHMAVCDWFGTQAGMHHWVNVMLHALAAVVLFAGLKRATQALWPSAFAAFVFALHPLHVESVAWISERKDVLSTLLFFLALYAYVLYAERATLRRYGLVVTLFALGLMSKPMLVTFPFTLLLLDVWPLRRTEWPRTVWEKIPLFALSIASAMVTYFVQRSGGAVQALPLGESVRNALISYVVYIGQTLWPAGLAIFYPYRESSGWWQMAVALAVILSVSALAISAWRDRPYIATGWFWYLGTLVPVIGLVQVGFQSHADRYMYVPMVGLSIILAWGAAEVVRKWPRTKHGIGIAAVVSCVACLSAASAQAEYWRNSETLYLRAISVTKNNFMAENNLADYLVDVPGRAAEAVPHFEAALRIKPDSAIAHNGFGGYLLQAGRDAEAAVQFETALRIDPSFAAAHLNLGIVFSRNPDRLPDAEAQYEAALRSAPDFAQAHKYLGMLLLRLKRTPEAIAHFEAAQRIRSDPDVAAILKALGNSQVRLSVE